MVQHMVVLQIALILAWIFAWRHNDDFGLEPEALDLVSNVTHRSTTPNVSCLKVASRVSYNGSIAYRNWKLP